MIAVMFALALSLGGFGEWLGCHLYGPHGTRTTKAPEEAL